MRNYEYKKRAPYKKRCRSTWPASAFIGVDVARSWSLVPGFGAIQKLRLFPATTFQRQATFLSCDGYSFPFLTEVTRTIIAADKNLQRCHNDSEVSYSKVLPCRLLCNFIGAPKCGTCINSGKDEVLNEWRSGRASSFSHDLRIDDLTLENRFPVLYSHVTNKNCYVAFSCESTSVLLATHPRLSHAASLELSERR